MADSMYGDLVRRDLIEDQIRIRLAPRGRSSRLLYRGSFVRPERCDRLLAARELKNEARNVILSVGREAPRRVNGSIQQFRHKLKDTLV
jgi:hypothetical protein